MTSRPRLVLTLLLVVMVAGCGLSKDDIAATVKTSMQQTFDSDPQFRDWHLRVTGVQVLRKGGNQYQGMAKITYEGTSHDVPVEITVDGRDVMWQTAPGAFLFVVQKEMEKLLEDISQ